MVDVISGNQDKKLSSRHITNLGPANTFASQEIEVKYTRMEIDHRPTSGFKRYREEHAKDKEGKRTKQKKNKTDKPMTKKRPFLSGGMAGKNRHSNKLKFRRLDRLLYNI